MNPEYLALVKIGALLEAKSPGETIRLEKLIGSGGMSDLIEKTFGVRVHNGESTYHLLQRILGEIEKTNGEDVDMSDPDTIILS